MSDVRAEDGDPSMGNPSMGDPPMGNSSMGNSSMGSTIGDEATTDDEVLGPEELDDVTDDGSLGDGTLGDGELADGGDVLDEMLANHGSAGLNNPGMASDPSESGSGEPGDQPEQLDADAMGRPVSGSMNDDDQGMENAGRNLGG